MTAREQSDRPRYPLEGAPDVRLWECASTEIQAAPACAIIVNGFLDGRRQQIRIDAEEVDELTRRLHQAKRHARARSATT